MGKIKGTNIKRGRTCKRSLQVACCLAAAALCGCAQLSKAYQRVAGDLPAFTVVTGRGDVISRDGDGNTTVTVTPIYIPMPQAKPQLAK